MVERQTIKIELPITKKEVIIKEWLTGREYEETQKPFYDSYLKGDEGIDIQMMTHKMLESYVISVGGIAKDVLEILMDLPYEDYNFVIQKLNELKKKE